jgi:hypothetical protein
MLNKMCLVQEMLAAWHVIRNEEQVLWTDLRTHGSPFLQQILDIDGNYPNPLRPADGSSVGIDFMISDPLQAQIVSACSEMWSSRTEI